MSPTDPTEVQKIIKSMKPKKSSGHDNLSGKLIKAISKEICTPLSIVINMSLESGVLSDSTKLAKVIPIYKAKTVNYLKIIAPYLCCLFCLKYLKKLLIKDFINMY